MDSFAWMEEQRRTDNQKRKERDILKNKNQCKTTENNRCKRMANENKKIRTIDGNASVLKNKQQLKIIFERTRTKTASFFVLYVFRFQK